jgi:hypothetical protein
MGTGRGANRASVPLEFFGREIKIGERKPTYQILIVIIFERKVKDKVVPMLN